jgi:hypothetical protein|tara:strand:- start:113 stop:517 length:405 start_codon:yes stop_codon:yes gene_type:complete
MTLGKITLPEVDNDRRRAVDCRLIRKSKSNKGYYKYIVTIKEKNGTVHEQPAYGKDMQDAINRLVWTERNTVVVDKLERKAPLWVFLIWVISILVPSLYVDYLAMGPKILLYTMGIPVLIFVGASLWSSWLDKK